MPTTLEDEMLKSIRGLKLADRPATFNDLARQFGVNASLVAALGRQLVNQGLAEPTYAIIHGERTMFGLRPRATESTA
jgi:Mn-dependent DtxR family transcriptional regulator